MSSFIDVFKLSTVATVLAFDVGGTRIKAGLVRGAGVSSMTVASTEADDGANHLLSVLARVGGQVADGEEIDGIGVCLKGIVDPIDGVLLDVDEALVGWIGQPIGTMIGDRLGLSSRVRCVVENDARMYALGEFLHGAGQGSQNIVCLTLGTGVGTGVVLDGRVLRGRRGTAGILGGHLSVQVDGQICACGNVGCLQTLIGTEGMVAAAKEALDTRQSSALRACQLSPETVFRAAAHGDHMAREVVERFSTYLGAGVVSLIHAYEPEVVVLGGGFSHSWPQFLPAVQSYVDAHAWTIPRGRVRILPSELGDAAALIGVAALAGVAEHLT